MWYLALACDFDETLARHGQVRPETTEALEKLRSSGRKLILVTGREFDDLLSVYSRVELFEMIVVENGAMVYCPTTKEIKMLAEAPPEELLGGLSERRIPYSKGRAILSTGRDYDTALLETISDLGLEHQVIFNKGSVMVLPAGINKATGLSAALDELRLSPHNVVGIGDAENDHAFLSLCECSFAVANALPAIRERADFVTGGENGMGIIELAEELLSSDLRDRDQLLTRRHILLGSSNGSAIRFSPQGKNILVTGSSGGGKSTIATALLERLMESSYQFCVVDPEGDYESFDGAVALGNNRSAPGAEEILKVLEDPEANVVANLVGLGFADRSAFLAGLLPRLQELRSRTGRPHWIVLDETHHVLPASWDPAVLTLPKTLERMIFITVHPDQVVSTALQSVGMIIAVGENPRETLSKVSQAIGEPAPATNPKTLRRGEAFLWNRESGSSYVFQIAPSRTQRRRHQRKYAEGELPPDRSFYFKGPEGKLNLRAQNLILFMQIAEGLDDDTWLYHLRRGDYSRWFREHIKDESLGGEAARVEAAPDISAAESRQRIKELIEQRYTLPEK
ncbi:MAG: HAD hydrolase family protein [Deltaproteobacteria bacterium]|nr:HAD hydrolase family protein [Deltaproteobacteria bacterium]